MKRLLSLASCLLIAACADQSMLGGLGGSSQTPAVPTAESSTIVGDVSDPRNRAKTRTELASLYFGRGNMAIALEELRAAALADPNYAPAHSMFGLVYMELRENQLAEQSFKRALSLAPNDSDINHNYGWFLCQTGRESDSMKYFLQAIRNPLYPTPWRSYSTAGQCLLKSGNLSEAEAYFTQALKLDPDEPISLLKLGDIRLRQGNLDEARRMVQRFHKLVDPNPESLWLGVRVERKLGEKLQEQSFANQLRRRYPSSREYQLLQRGEYD
jgi:type IV pilus assembly protein PilF